MELADPLCAPSPDMSEGRGGGLGRALVSPVLRAQKDLRPAGWLQSLLLTMLLTATTTPSPREKQAQRVSDMTEATQLGADKAGFRGRSSAAGPHLLPRGGQGAGPSQLHPHPQPPVAFADLGSVYLQDSLLSVRSQDDSLLAFSSPDAWPSPDEPPSPGWQLRPRLPGSLGPEAGARPQGPLRSGDGGLPSEEEDEVFYN